MIASQVLRLAQAQLNIWRSDRFPTAKLQLSTPLSAASQTQRTGEAPLSPLRPLRPLCPTHPQKTSAFPSREAQLSPHRFATVAKHRLPVIPPIPRGRGLCGGRGGGAGRCAARGLRRRSPSPAPCGCARRAAAPIVAFPLLAIA